MTNSNSLRINALLEDRYQLVLSGVDGTGRQSPGYSSTAALPTLGIVLQVRFRLEAFVPRLSRLIILHVHAI